MKKLISTLLAALMLLSCGTVPASLAENIQPPVPALGALDESDAVANGGDEYRVYVQDPEGNPVEGVLIQFCDDSTCAFLPTDSEGVAAFVVDEEKAYEVHVLQAPEGYGPDDRVYRTLEVFSDVSVILERVE